MPKWIHDRAMSLKKDMEKTYGPEKAEQVAFAVATQQAHKLGKSPKTFKSKVTGKKERFGTPEGKAVAKAKFDKPKSEYKKTAADSVKEMAEILKEARRIGVSDFLGGIDPTGGATFQYGMEDVEDPTQKAHGARALGTAGGLVGGAVVVPASISGLIEGGKGLVQTSGGLGKRLAGAGRGLVSGAMKPFKQVAGGIKARGVMDKVRREGTEALTEADLATFKNFGEMLPGAGLMKNLQGIDVDKAVAKGTEALVDRMPSLLREGVRSDISGAVSKAPSELEQFRAVMGKMTPEQLTAIDKHIGSQLTGGLTTLGTSGLIGGGSAALQYGKGQAAAQRYKDQGLMPQSKTASQAMDTILATNESTKKSENQLNPQKSPLPNLVNSAELTDKAVKGDDTWGDIKKLFSHSGEKPTFQREEKVSNPDSEKPSTPTIKVAGTEKFLVDALARMVY